MTFCIQKGNIYAVPAIHYNMELAAHVHNLFKEIRPDCVAVELAETMQLQLLRAASRLPDISLVAAENKDGNPLYYMAEPCDASFEALRSALENGSGAFCIDLDVDAYPDVRERLPDPYSITRIGLENYFNAYRKLKNKIPIEEDRRRELHMARRLKELSLRYEKILFVGGMGHVEAVLKDLDKNRFPEYSHADREVVELFSLTEESAREVMGEFGWLARQYEIWRQDARGEPIPDRQKIIYNLYKQSSENYIKATGSPFPGYNLRNTMKFSRNYALITGHLMPDLFQILSAAKGAVDHNYAYECWLLGTDYPFRRNVDGLPELNLKAEDVWGNSKIIRFHRREPSKKGREYKKRRKDRSDFRFEPPKPFSICSYQPEDAIVEKFGAFLQKKGVQLASEEGARIVPFTASIEDGIDTRETIRHWHENKLYVKIFGKPQGGVGSVVVVFNEDDKEKEDFPWKTTWLGENEQESDMAFYATEMTENIVGPGISRCSYGGFMMSYPPRRLWDIWQDPDYFDCRTKAEALLMAAIDYAVKPLIVYVAEKAPRSFYKNYAKRFGKKVVYIPIGQLSPITLNKIRSFHVLDGQDKRRIADEYIF